MKKPDKLHYQKVTTQIDHLALGGMWRSFESRSYTFSRFKGTDLPTWSTPGVKTAVGETIASGGVMSVKTTVTLKRVLPGRLPDDTVWKYSVRSKSFECGQDF